MKYLTVLLAILVLSSPAAAQTRQAKEKKPPTKDCSYAKCVSTGMSRGYSESQAQRYCGNNPGWCAD